MNSFKFASSFQKYVIFPEESILCYCEPPDYCPDGTGTCVLSPGSQCFSSIEEDADGEEPFRTYGCLPPEESSDMQVT